MARPDTSIDERILACAIQEFAARSFKDASLRKICASANVTTGAFYKRYKNKEELFDAVVAPALVALANYSEQIENMNYEHLSRDDMRHIWNITPQTQKRIIDMLYNDEAAFRLLLMHAQGTRYENFIHDFVTDVTKRSIKFMRKAHKLGIAPKPIGEEELHMLLTAYWATLFEPLAHGLSRKRALQHSEYVAKLFDWTSVLGF